MSSLLQAAVPVASAWLMKTLVDRLVRPDPGPVAAPLAGLAALGVAALVLPHLVTYQRQQIERAVARVAHDRLYRAVERFVGLARFEDPGFHDRLRLAQQACGVTSSQLIGDVLSTACLALTLLGFLGALLTVSPVLVAVVVGAVLPLIFAEQAMARRRAAMMWGLSPVERRELFYSTLLSSVEAAKEVRLFDIGAFLRDRMGAERLAADRTRRAQDRRELRVQAWLALLGALVAAGGLYWAVTAVAAGRLGIGDLSLFVAGVAGVQSSLIGLSGALGRASRQLMLFDHYLAVVGAEPDLPVAARPRLAEPLRHGLELRDVWFRYSDEHPWVLRGVSVFIPAGAAFALVGRNGAGKSTLVKLLCRMYDPTRGEIRWDGVDIREFEPRSLRRRIGAVFQDFMRYDLSARDNILLGDTTAEQEPQRVAAAAASAGVHEMLSALPRGYDTMLTRMFRNPGEEQDDGAGVILSGGQWQRIALARALLRVRRDLMILDEPSSGLDAAAEQEVQELVRQQRTGATSVLISHRLGAVRDADVIAVLSAGRIVELGTHRELLALGGDYATLFTTQASGYVEDVPLAG